jgi:hypothetical protein
MALADIAVKQAWLVVSPWIVTARGRYGWALVA